MKKNYTLIPFLFLAFLLQAQGPVSKVQVIHNSPSPTVDVYANGDLLIDDFEFRTATAFLDVPAGVGIDLAIAPDTSTSAASAIATFPGLIFDETLTYVVVANGIVGDAQRPFGLQVNAMARTNSVNPAEVDVAAFHGSPDAPAVDISARTLGTPVTGLDFGEFSGYLSLPPATYLLDVLLAGQSNIVTTVEADLSALAGEAVTVFASGFAGGGDPGFGLFAALADGTVVQLPVSAAPRLVINEIDYDQSGPDTTEFIEITNIGSAAASLAGVSLELVNGGSASVYATVNLPDQMLGVGAYFVVCFGDNTSSYCDMTETTAIQNGAPDAVALTFENNLIDALSYEGSVPGYVEGSGDGLVDITGESFTGLSRVPDGTDTDSNISDFSRACITPGAANTDQSSGCQAPPATARLQVIHNSPSVTVDIYANGNLLLDDFAFRTATPFIDVPAGVEIDLAVAPDTSTSAESALVVFENIVFEEAETYIVTANGVVGSVQFPFDLVIEDMARESADIADQVDILAFHGSPGAPAVDVDARGVGTLIENLSYGNYGDYLSVAPGVYYLDVRLSGTTSILATFEADLSALEGESITLFASGFPLSDPRFGLFAALADGTVVPLQVVTVARVQLIHNSPSPTVDIYANGELLLDNFEFRTATPYLTLPADVEIDIAIAPDTSTSAESALTVFEDVIFENAKTYVVTANGVVGAVQTPFDLVVKEGARETAADMNQVDILAFHGSPGAPPVDVDARAVGTLLENLGYGNYSDYLSVVPDLYYLDVRLSGTTGILATFEADLSALAGQSVTLFASGFPLSEPRFGLFAALADGTVVQLPVTEVARVQVIHNAPSPTVDIYANGELFLDDFAFRTATPFTTLPAGVEINIGVALDNSTSVEDTLVNFPVMFENGKTYVVAADGIVGDANFPFTLHVSDMGEEEAEAGDVVAIAALHGSPGAPNVDIDARTVGTIISDLAYGEFTGYLSLDTALYYLDVRAAGDPDIVATFAADLRGLGGAAATIFASGLLGDDPAFGLFAALADGTVVALPPVQVARVQVIHNSPNPTVDVYANGALLLDDFAFRTAIPFTTLPAGVNIDLGIALDNSTSVEDTLVNFPVMFENGKTYVVVATGIVGNMDTPFDLAVFDMGRESTTDGTGVDLLLYHGSTDAPAVDVLVEGGGTLFDDVAYTDFQGYVSVPAGQYTLNLTPADDNTTVVESYQVDLSGAEGLAATVFASGFFDGTDPAFQIWVALPDGVTFPLLTTNIRSLTDKLGYYRAAPNPARSMVQVSYELSEKLDLQLHLYDANGRLLQLRNLGDQLPGEYTEAFNVEQLPEGVYFLNLVSSQGVANQRIIVTR